MRCLTLAETLAARGLVCAFAVNGSGAALMKRFGAGFALYRQDVGSALQAGDFDAMVIDDYGVAAEQEAAFRQQVGVLAVIDDMADRAHLADLLIDPGYGRKAADYGGLLPQSAVLLTGPTYALVRPSFVALRSGMLARPIVPAPKRLFMSFGLSDVDGIAGRAAAAVRARYPDVVVEIALGSDAESAMALRSRAKADHALHLYFDAQNIAELMAGADAAIGAGGASTWERACLGLPTLAVVIADNQRRVISRLETDGAVLAIDLLDANFDRMFVESLEKLWAPDVRAALRIRSAALCDGLGGERIADAILQLTAPG